MRHFLWKIAGADYKILEKAGKESQYSFWLIGLLYLIVIFITFVGFLGMFWGIFDNIIPTLVGTSVLGFLVSTIYCLSLISLEPNTLPVIIEKKSLVLTYFVRYFILILFAFFVSKTFEMVVFNLIKSIGFINYEGSSDYMKQLMLVNTNEPWIWVITLSIISALLIFCNSLTIYFASNPPARETVEVSRLPKDVNVEISCIAIV